MKRMTFIAAIAGTLAACSLSERIGDDYTPLPAPGSGGASAAGGDPTGGGPGAGGGGGSTADGGGDVVSCNDAQECPGNTSDCRAPDCDNGECGFEQEMAGVACSDGAGANETVCDGMGACVQCNTSSDCTFDTNLTICSNNICVNAGCSNGTVDGTETGADDGNGMECGGDVCGPCVTGEPCNVDGDCISRSCMTVCQ